MVQLWDKNKFRKDVMLGEMVMDITHFKGTSTFYTTRIDRSEREGGASSAAGDVAVSGYVLPAKIPDVAADFKKPRNLRFQSQWSKYKKPGDEVDTINLLDTESLRGWWPVLNKKHFNKKDDDDAAKKKDDDYDPKQLYIMGLVELEMSLVTAAEAEADPVGRKRKEPNHVRIYPKYMKCARSYWKTSLSEHSVLCC
ncbi:unnamed protein product [Cylicostephanus goldi]|uniref:Ferlin C-terminal domain-containing protein n=1 Tax=Cylicostephanus goldi TaxID=71465 RepID=A0A3P6RHH5_CYLGO|nr:unnamed protein product [Cylicostephanus goldi]